MNNILANEEMKIILNLSIYIGLKLTHIDLSVYLKVEQADIKLL